MNSPKKNFWCVSMCIDGDMDKESLTDYIKWLLSQVDETQGDLIEKETVRTMFLSIIGEMYSH